MKFMTLFFLFASLSTFAQTQNEISPELEKCSDDFNLLTLVQSPISKFSTTIAGDINVFALAHSSGDPAIWSLLHKVGITFPVQSEMGSDIACYTIEKAALLNMKNVKSIGYDAKHGRLLSITVDVATADNDGNISGKTKTLKVRVNKAKGTVTLEK